MIEFTKDGRIKDFSVPDAHTLYVKAFLVTNLKKPVRVEAITIPDLKFLDDLHNQQDTQDGLIMGTKWAITPEVIKSLKEHGEASQYIPGHPLRFEYKLRKTKHADNLRHKG